MVVFLFQLAFWYVIILNPWIMGVEFVKRIFVRENEKWLRKTNTLGEKSYAILFDSWVMGNWICEVVLLNAVEN